MTTGLLTFVTGQLDMTAAQAAAAVASGTNPAGNSVCMVNAQAAPSVSLALTGYGAQQGNNANPSGFFDTVAPQGLVNLQNQIIIMAASNYRI